MQQTPRDSATWILNEFNRRKALNKSLSLRAFARFLKMPHSRLSELMSSKRTLTYEAALKVADRLELPPAHRARFLAAVEADYNLTRKKSRGGFSASPSASGEPYHVLQEDIFSAISDWSHYAILSLTEIKGFKSDEIWIARRLNLSPLQVREAVSRLMRLQLLKIENGKLRATHENLTTTNDIPSVALRLGHSRLLEKAGQVLRDVPVDRRDITSMILAIDPKKIKRAKDMIKKFRRQLTKMLEAGDRQEVFTLAIQLFPLTNMEDPK